MSTLKPPSKLLGLAFSFFRAGVFGFGGPAALVAFFERDFVGQRKWIASHDFEQDYVFCKMLPGPVAYQMALAVGARVAGIRGALLSAFCFLLPGVTLMLSLSVAYQQVRTEPLFVPLLAGLRVGSLVLILESVWAMLYPHRHSIEAWAFVLLGSVWMLLFPSWEPVIILGCGAASVLWMRLKGRVIGLDPISVSLVVTLFWIHLKAGAFVFGTGLAIMPFLERELVGVHHWLTSEQFLDGLALGQVTPGPLTVAAAFFGHQIGGIAGGLASIVGIYLPGVFFVLLLLPQVRRWARSKEWLGVFQLGAVAAVIGCIFASTVFLARQAFTDANMVGLFVFLLLVRFAFRKTPIWLPLPLGAVLALLGYAWSHLHP